MERLRWMTDPTFAEWADYAYHMKMELRTDG